MIGTLDIVTFGTVRRGLTGHHRRTGVQPCVNGDTSFQWEVLWLSAFFFQQDPLGSDPSTDRHAKWLKRRVFRQGCAFCSKNWKFLYHLAPSPQKPPKFGPFWSGLRKFSLDFALALDVSLVNTLKSSPEPPKTIIVNRQCGDGKSKYGVRFCIGGPCHVTSWPRHAKIVT